MGSYSEFCHLCVSDLNDCQKIRLDETSEAPKLIKSVLGIEIDLYGESALKQVCQNCLYKLQSCSDFIIKCHRVVDAMKNKVSVDLIRSEFMSYEYVLPSSSENRESSSFICKEEFSPSLFDRSSFNSNIGSKESFEDNCSRKAPIANSNVTEQGSAFSSQVTSINKETSSSNSVNFVIEVEPKDNFQIYKPFAERTKLHSIELDLKQNEVKDAAVEVSKVRKILPKAHQSNNLQLKTSDVQSPPAVMIPVVVKTPCKSCGQIIIASKYQDLENHVCNGKNNIKTLFQCPATDCDLSFSSQQTLKYHFKYNHGPKASVTPLNNMKTRKTDSVPGQFVCNHEGCQKSYRAKSYLIEHERLHTGEKPYKCNNCSRRFYRIMDKKKHCMLKVCY